MPGIKEEIEKRREEVRRGRRKIKKYMIEKHLGFSSKFSISY